MKFVLRDLRVGESIEGRVAEVISSDEVIISFAGDLVRVVNETRRPLHFDDRVVVQITALDPLRFRLAPSRNERRERGRFDVSV